MSAEDEARVWMESALGEKFEGSFCDALKSGERLVKLANRIKVNSIPKYNVNPTMPIKKSENITFFLKTIRSWGMTEYQMFETSDIDKGNLKPVVNCLHALGSLLQSKAEFESLDLPKLGIKAVGKNERKFTDKQKHDASAAVSLFNLGSSNMGKAAVASAMSGQAVTVAGFVSPAPASHPKGPPPALGGEGGPLTPPPSDAPLPAGWEKKPSKTYPGHFFFERQSDMFSSWEHPTTHQECYVSPQ